MDLYPGRPPKNTIYMAGIVPVAGTYSDRMHFPWDPALIPVGPNCLAVERAVLECAYAGCKTIWVVCNDDMQPLLRKRMGTMVLDPRSTYKHNIRGVWQPRWHRRYCYIYYVPIHPRDRGRRDSFSWSVLAGVRYAHDVSSALTKWMVPNKYYVAFPQGLNKPTALWQNRRLIKTMKPFYLRFAGKTVADGLPLSFTLDYKMFKEFKANIHKSPGKYESYKVDEETGIPYDRVLKSIEERWPARKWSVEQVFKHDLDPEAKFVDLDMFWSLDNWWNYRKAMAWAPKMIHIYAQRRHLPRKEWNPACADDEEVLVTEDEDDFEGPLVLSGWSEDMIEEAIELSEDGEYSEDDDLEELPIPWELKDDDEED